MALRRERSGHRAERGKRTYTSGTPRIPAGKRRARQAGCVPAATGRLGSGKLSGHNAQYTEAEQKAEKHLVVLVTHFWQKDYQQRKTYKNKTVRSSVKKIFSWLWPG